jgi:hypothetical protein
MNEIFSLVSEALDANQDLALIMAYLGESSSDEPVELGRKLICNMVEQRLNDTAAILQDVLNQSGRKSS